MVYCAAVNCKNGSRKNQSDNKNKVAFFNFPNGKIRRICIQKVRRKQWTPTRNSKLCSDHFEGSCFVQNLVVSKSIGWSHKKLELKPDAVPTLFDNHQESKRRASEATSVRPAYAKRRRHEVSYTICYL